MMKFVIFIMPFILLLATTCSADSEMDDAGSISEGDLTDQTDELPDLTDELDTGLTNSNPTTYYIRPDGGSAEECTGIEDAPYPGVGNGQPCAWDHLFRALPPGRPARIKGGDTLIIAAGSYRMGYGAPGADMCESDYPWDCFMSQLPSGSPGSPTRILGKGWDSGCVSPPELWGTERAQFILNLEGSSFVEIACLEITDHEGCAEDHSGGLACQRDDYPYGDWAAVGLFATDSADVYLHHLDIHGLANGGVLAGRLADWSVEDVRIAGNGLVGWDGDLEGNDASEGVLTFRRWTVEWNGCVETYPEGEPTGCWAQTAGGYGDGVGTGETGGTWIIEDAAFLHNTSDGLDLLYTRLEDSKVIIRRTISAGNAGDQIKTTGSTYIENVLAISNCGFFDGQPFTHNVDYCRAGGSALVLNPRSGDQLSIVNSTITGQGDCLVIAECGDDGGCAGSEMVLIRNSILLGNPEFRGEGDVTCLAWSDFSHDPFIYDHDIISDLKSMPASCPAGSLCDSDPGVTNNSIEIFDAYLLPTSPAIDAGTADGAPADDLAGLPRDDSPDIGAYEYR